MEVPRAGPAAEISAGGPGRKRSLVSANKENHNVLLMSA
jgi:hypothetical protein